jgi:hypothetical protein
MAGGAAQEAKGMDRIILHAHTAELLERHAQ